MENSWYPRLESLLPHHQLTMYLPTTDQITKKSTQDFEGKRLILFFYPADFTFVCPTELKDLNSNYIELQANDAEVVVISTDTVFSHKRWKETEKLLEGFDIPMASDRTGEISKFLGIWNEITGNSERATFIISPDGVIKGIEIVTEPIGRNSAELVRKVKALDFVRDNPWHACPASRNTGDKTLQPSIKIAGHVGEELKKVK